MPIGNEYLNAITGFEGFTPKATWDYKQWSNGYGTRARFPGEVISQAEAKQRYQQELEAANRHVKSLGVQLDPGKEAALTDLTYNSGTKWMGSGLGQAVKAGDWNTAKQRFLQYNKAGGRTLPGLVKRRMVGASWLGGEPPQTSSPQSSPTPTNEAPTMPNQTGVPVPASYSPETISQQRRMAMQLMQQGQDSSPVQHWTQALARVLQGGMGGYRLSQADKQDRMMQGEGNALLGQFLGSMTGGASPAGMPSGQPQMIGQALSGEPAPMTPDEQGVAKFASSGLAAALPQQAQTVPQAPPVQVADAGGTVPPQVLQQMLANPQTRPIAEKYIQQKMKPDGAAAKPSNVQEWEYFQGLSDQDKQKYIAMKRGEKFLDAGTQFVNPRTGEVVTKDLAGAERAQEIGTAQGKQIAAAPGDIATADDALSLVESLKVDPNREWGTGMSSVLNVMPGTPGKSYQLKVNQARSGAFLTAIKQLRGMGALSNAEGQTATDAVTRLNTADTEEGFLKALADYETLVRRGRAKAEQILSGTQSADYPTSPSRPDIKSKYQGLE
jgi:lysozyme